MSFESISNFIQTRRTSHGSNKEIVTDKSSKTSEINNDNKINNEESSNENLMDLRALCSEDEPQYNISFEEMSKENAKNDVIDNRIQKIKDNLNDIEKKINEMPSWQRNQTATKEMLQKIRKDAEEKINSLEKAKTDSKEREKLIKGLEEERTEVILQLSIYKGFFSSSSDKVKELEAKVKTLTQDINALKGE